MEIWEVEGMVQCQEHWNKIPDTFPLALKTLSGCLFSQLKNTGIHPMGTLNSHCPWVSEVAPEGETWSGCMQLLGLPLPVCLLRELPWGWFLVHPGRQCHVTEWNMFPILLTSERNFSWKIMSLLCKVLWFPLYLRSRTILFIYGKLGFCLLTWEKSLEKIMDKKSWITKSQPRKWEKNKHIPPPPPKKVKWTQKSHWKLAGCYRTSVS